MKFKYVRTINDNTAISYSSGTALDFTITVQERNSSTLQATTTTSINKIREGATGGPGAQGDDAPRIVTGYVYWEGAVGTTPTSSNLPSCSFTFGGAAADSSFSPAIGGGPAAGTTSATAADNWSMTPPQADGTRTTVFYATFTATETVTPGSASSSETSIYADSSGGKNSCTAIT